VAKGIVEALQEVNTDVPMVARIVGTNQEEGNRILAQANIVTADSFAEAVQIAVEMARQ
jgi:succinyl-CoA synthetase beta subunit